VYLEAPLNSRQAPTQTIYFRYTEIRLLSSPSSSSPSPSSLAPGKRKKRDKNVGNARTPTGRAISLAKSHVIILALSPFPFPVNVCLVISAPRDTALRVLLSRTKTAIYLRAFRRISRCPRIRDSRRFIFQPGDPSRSRDCAGTGVIGEPVG